MVIKFSNNARSGLASNVSATDTSITVVDASVFPLLVPGDVLYLTIANTTNTVNEIIKCTAITGNTLTVSRGEEGTTPTDWTIHDNVSSRLTAELLETITARAYNSIDTTDDVVFNSTTVNSVQLVGGTGTQGTLSWNIEDETVDLVVGPNVTYQLGQELGVVARNLSGVTLVNGQVVKVTGASGDKITVDLADSTTEQDSSTTFAIVTEDITNNSTGHITTNGLVRGLDTSAFAEGVAIWLGTAGQFTATKPASPEHLVHVGWVVRSHATEGSILVRISNGWELDELHDVLITNITDNEILQWNAASSVWENRTLAEAGISATGHTHSYLPLSGGTLTGAVTTTSTIDGRDLSVDGAKLDGIESGATADQTGAEIKAAYEGEANTNAFTDAEKTKLSGIEVGADVTDTANVTAAGALMDSEVTNLAQVKAFDSTDYATAAQGTTADSAVQPGDNVSTLTNDASYATTSYVDTAEADARSYANSIVASEAGLRSLGDSNTLSSANAYTDSAVAGLVDSSPGTLNTLNELAAALGDDPNFATTITNLIGTKLNSSAYTAADVLAKLKTVDGAGSGLDADLLDGQQGSFYRNASNLNAGIIPDARLPDSITSSITGNAATATKLATARTIALSGDVTGSASFNGSANATITAVVADDSHNHDRFGAFLADKPSSNADTVGDVGGFSVRYLTSAATNKPTGADHAIQTSSFSSGWQTQQASDWRTNAWYVRTQNNESWNSWQRLFADNYHPNADKWTTARTLSLTGDVTGSASFDGSANVTLTATVGNDSHTHDGRYFTESESNSRFAYKAGSSGQDFNTRRIITNGTGNDYNSGGIEVKGNGSANTVYPTVGFHQSGKYAGSLQMRAGGDFGFYTQGGSSYGVVRAATFYGALSGNASTASKWATARTLTLSGGASGSVSFDGSSNITLTAAVANDSHNHTNLDGITKLRFGPGVSANDDAAIEWLGASNAGYLRFSTADDNGTEYMQFGDYDTTSQGGAFTQWLKMYRGQAQFTGNVSASTFTGALSGNASTASKWATGRTIKIGNTSKTVDGSANVTWSISEIGVAPSGYGLGTYGRSLPSSILGNTALRRESGFWQGPSVTGLPTYGHSWKYLWTQAHSNSSGYWGYIGVDFDCTAAFFGGQSGGVDKTAIRLFADNYHPNADKWTTARTLSLSGDASGSVSWDGSGNASMAVTVADDSHNHVIANVDGLQTALNAKLASSSYTAADVLAKIKTVDGAGSGLDADLLAGVAAAGYARTTGTYSGLRAQATTKADVGLSNVANYGVTSSVSSTSTTHYATASAVKAAYDRASAALSAQNKVYTGTDPDNLDFPIGTMVTAFVGGIAPSRNQTTTLYLYTHSEYPHMYASEWHPNFRGAALNGTWAVRGAAPPVGNSYTRLFQRIA